MPTNPRTVTPQLVFGVFIMLMGALLVFDRITGLHTSERALILPLACISIGVSLLLTPREDNKRFWGGFWTVLGLWVLLNRLNWIHFGVFDLLGPIVLIALGASLMRHTLRRHVTPETPVGEAGRVTIFAFMSGANRASADTPFRGGEMTAIMGHSELDLRRAIIPPGEEAVITLFNVMGGHEIVVPPSWDVRSDVVLLLGGLEDKRLIPLDPPAGDRPRLVLKGHIFMGGVVIKS